MTNEYYGVASTPTEDFLAHYGVRGMKWGVRKAIEKGNAKRLDRNYKRAAKKLAKLNERANVEAQSAKAKKFNKVAKVAGKIGATGTGLAVAGTGTDHTLHYINSLHKQIAQNKLDDIDRKMAKSTDDHLDMLFYNNEQYHKGKISKQEHQKTGDQITQLFKDDQNKLDKEWHEVKDNFNKGKDKRKLAADIGRYVSYVGAGVGAAGLGTAAVAKGRAIAAKRRTTAKGHAKAVAERDAWKKEMNKAFSGTKYQGQYAVPSKQKKRRK